MKIKVRKKKEIEEIQNEREKKRQERFEKEDAWIKHWEKDPSAPNMKKLKKGGFKRPRIFKFDDEIDKKQQKEEQERQEAWEQKQAKREKFGQPRRDNKDNQNKKGKR